MSAHEMGSMIRSWSGWRFGKVWVCSSRSGARPLRTWWGRSLLADPLTVDRGVTRGQQSARRAATAPVGSARRRGRLSGGWPGGGAVDVVCGPGAAERPPATLGLAIDDVSHDKTGSKHVKGRITGPWRCACATRLSLTLNLNLPVCPARTGLPRARASRRRQSSSSVIPGAESSTRPPGQSGPARDVGDCGHGREYYMRSRAMSMTTRPASTSTFWLWRFHSSCALTSTPATPFHRLDLLDPSRTPPVELARPYPVDSLESS